MILSTQSETLFKQVQDLDDVINNFHSIVAVSIEATAVLVLCSYIRFNVCLICTHGI